MCFSFRRDEYGTSSKAEIEARKEAQLRTARATFLGVLDIALLVAQALPTQIPKAVIDSVSMIAKSAQTTAENLSSEKEILAQLAALSNNLQDSLTGINSLDVSPELNASVGRLINRLAAISADCRESERQNRSFLVRFLQREQDAGNIVQMAQRTRDALQEFQLSSGLRQEVILRGVANDVDEVKQTGARIATNVKHIEESQKNAEKFREEDMIRELLDRLKPADQASYDSHRASAIAMCLPGTCTVILEEIMAWVTDDKSDASRVFWVHGTAGRGKSTIAKTIADRTKPLGLLGASFAFSRRLGNVDLRDPSKVIPTLAYQLGCLPSHQKAIFDAVRACPDVASKQLQQQAQILLEKPFPVAEYRGPPLVVVIDAFDECEGDGATELLRLLVASAISTHDSTPSLKILITSRGEHDLQAIFNSFESAKIRFCDVDKQVTQSDTELYLETRMEEMAKKLTVLNLGGWYTKTELQALAQKSGNLFIYATTAIRFLEQIPPGDPRGRLLSLLKDSIPGLSNINTLYTEILQETSDICRDEPEFRRQFQEVMGAYILLRTSLPMSAMGKLLDLPVGKIQATLYSLGSLIRVPLNDEAPKESMLYHPSFPEYLLDSSRCTDKNIHVNKDVVETYLAIRCLTRLTDDLASESSTLELTSVTAFRYSAQYWDVHLSAAIEGNQGVVTALARFARTHFLRWLEVLSIMRMTTQSGTMMTAALSWATCSGCSRDLVDLLRDGEQFTRTFADTINAGYPHIYDSGLSFCPPGCSLWKTYQDNPSMLVRALVGVETNWPPQIGTFGDGLGHSERVRSIKFSPDASKLASGSDDRTVRIWSAVDGKCLWTLEGHTDWVMSVAFSSDGLKVVSASKDRTLRIWDLMTGLYISTLQGHVNWVRDVAFSADATNVVSGSDDTTVRIWDTATSKCISTLKGHSSWVRSVAFSPDSLNVASGSKDGTVRIWDTKTAECISILQGLHNWVASITFSPDGTRVMSEDSSWIIATGKSLQINLANKGNSSTLTPSSGMTELHPSGLSSARISNCWLYVNHGSAGVLRVLRMPLSCQPTAHPEICGNVIAVGCRNGRVFMIDLTAWCKAHYTTIANSIRPITCDRIFKNDALECSPLGRPRAFLLEALQMASIIARSLPTQIPKDAVDSVLEVSRIAQAMVDNMATQKETSDSLEFLIENLLGPLSEIVALEIPPERRAHLITDLFSIAADGKWRYGPSLMRHFFRGHTNAEKLLQEAWETRNALREFEIKCIDQEQGIDDITVTEFFSL